MKRRFDTSPASTKIPGSFNGRTAGSEPVNGSSILPPGAQEGKIMEDVFKIKIMLKDYTTVTYEVISAYLQDGLYNLILKDEIRRFSCQNILEVVEKRNVVYQQGKTK